MKITILGSGTSTGVPVIGCGCRVCTSSDKRNNRLRSSILVESNSGTILVDTTPDFRTQALRFDIKRVDAVLYTHAHADHIFGIDELRMYNLIMNSAINCYSSEITIKKLHQFFPYIFDRHKTGEFKPTIVTHVLDIDKDRETELFGIRIVPIEVMHGKETIFGYRFGNFAYLTDCKGLPEESMQRLYGIKVLVVGVAMYRLHEKHFNLDEALSLVDLLKPEQTYLTHLSHTFDHHDLLTSAPDGVAPAYDGMVLEV